MLRDRTTYSVGEDSVDGWIFFNPDAEEQWVVTPKDSDTIVMFGVGDHQIKYDDTKHHREVSWFTERQRC